jgi:hypothetical protein
MLLFPAFSLLAQELPVAFNWAFVKRASNGSPQIIDFSEKVAVSQGDLFKIIIQPARSSFVYLFLHDAQGDLDLLFPEKFEGFDTATYANMQASIPPGENWFTLDNAKGTERFYLFASATRLSGLEKLTLAYQKADQSKGNVDEARQAVLDEMGKLRKAHSLLTTAAEKPVTIAGGTRGINAAAAKLATRIEAKDFYTKTFRLEH